MQIKIKRLHPDAKIPSYSKAGDAGMDVYAVSKQEKDKFIEYGTGLAFEIPKGNSPLYIHTRRSFLSGLLSGAFRYL